MNIIVNIDAQRFSLNGIKYFKNFMSHVVGDNVRIVNAYDSKYQLLPWTGYADFTVDGLNYENVSDLQDALLPVLYTRNSLGPGGGDAVWGGIDGDIEDQADLIALIGSVNTPSTLEKQFGAGAVTITVGANTTPQEICDHINSVGFTVTAGQLILLALTVKKTISGQAYWYRQKRLFKRNNLVGTWGTGSTNGEIVPADIVALVYDVVQSAYTDSEDNVFINLGDLGSTAIHTYLNAFAGSLPGLTANELVDDGSIYYFECVIGEVYQTYKYIGSVPVTLGSGGDTVASGDFDLYSSSGVEPSTIPTEEQIFGKRIEGNISGDTTLHWNAFSVGVFTLTAAVELFDDNLPTGDNSRPIELLITGDEALDLPAYWEARPSNDTYDGTVWNHLVVSCINGNATEERIIYSLENLAT